MSEVEKIEFFKGLIEYAFEGKELKSKSDLVDLAFTMAKPSIDKSLKNRENGLKGADIKQEQRSENE